jgi:iron complex outermembrane receptor protein
MNLINGIKAGLLALGLTAVGQGIAQTDPTTPPDGSESRQRGIEEIVITATRREESSQTVAVSVNAYSPEELEKRNFRELRDLTSISPGLRFVHQGGGGTMNVVMRGLNRIPLGNAPNAVITYFADVPLNFLGSNIPAYDLESIQVLKGPQGTLFGRNAIGGAVVITPKAPTHEFGGYLKGGFGNYDYQTYEGALNLPIVEDKIALRLSGKIIRRDGYTEAIGVGRDHDDIHQDSYRASLLVTPTDTFANTTIVDYFKATEGGTGAVLAEVLDSGLIRLQVPIAPGFNISPFAPFWDCHTFDPITNPTPCQGFTPERDIDDALVRQKAVGPYKTFTNIDQRLFRRLWGVTNRTEWELGPVTLRNILSYRNTHVDADLNSDGLAYTPPIIDASGHQHDDQWSNEFQIFGKAFDDKLDYIGGLFYIKEEPDGKNGFIFPVASPVAPWVSAFVEKINRAAYGQVGYDLSAITDGLKINVGYRYNETEQETCAISSVQPSNITLTPDPPFEESDCRNSPRGSIIDTTEYASTWNIGLDWQINDNVFAYIVRRKGYREGGINTPAFNTPASSVLAPFQTYEPEELKDIEVGIKTDFTVAGRPVRFNLAVYESKYNNVITSFNTSQVVPADDPGAPQASALGINTGKRTISGAESTLIVEPFDGFSIAALAAYTDQEVDEATVPNIPGLQPPSLVPASPLWSASLAVTWVLPYQPLDGELVFNADHYYQQDYWIGNDNLPGYELTNLRLDWNGVNRSGVDVSFFVRNALDIDDPISSATGAASLGVFTRSYNEPRMYGMEVRYSFGQ